MIHRFAGWLLEAAARMLEDSIPEERLRSFLISDVGRLLDQAGGQADEAWPTWADDLRMVERLLSEAGLWQAREGLPEVAGSWPRQERMDLECWLEGMRNAPLIEAGCVPRGTAAALARLLGGEGPPDARKAMQERWLPALLRHVELKRREALRLRPGGTPLETWMERDETAILFVRAAKTWGDLRYLNAAMKLNDWGYAVHRRAVPVQLRARYLLALAEQEALIEAWEL